MIQGMTITGIRMGPMNPEEFGAWLLEQRKATGRSRDSVCRQAGFSTSTLQNIERGGRNVRGAWAPERSQRLTLLALARALQVPENEMLQRAPALAVHREPVAKKRNGEVDVRELLERIDGLTIEVARLVAVLA